MPFVKVAKTSALPQNSVIEVLVDDYPYAICNTAGEIRALSGVCIHRGGPLGQGAMHDGYVVCPYHMWEFDCRTGEYDYDPAKRVATFAVRVEGDDILLEVPERA
jgi:nitrite reductase/ring-hydroxylating ferredoxin subunit